MTSAVTNPPPLFPYRSPAAEMSGTPRFGSSSCIHSWSCRDDGFQLSWFRGRHGCTEHVSAPPGLLKCHPRPSMPLAEAEGPRIHDLQRFAGKRVSVTSCV